MRLTYTKKLISNHLFSHVFHLSFCGFTGCSTLTINLIHAYLQKHVDDRNSRDNNREKKRNMKVLSVYHTPQYLLKSYFAGFMLVLLSLGFCQSVQQLLHVNSLLDLKSLGLTLPFQSSFGLSGPFCFI